MMQQAAIAPQPTDTMAMPGEEHLFIEYEPQPKQRLLSECPANEILYGGSAGPGKSHAIRHEALVWANRIPKLQVYLFRRTYPELEKNHILPIIIEWGNRYGQYNDGKKYYRLPNQSMIHFCHAQHEKNVMLYHGAEIHLLIIDELSTFTEWMYVYLRNRVRCTLDLPQRYQGRVPGVICASNPGGVGHEFCKRLFVDFCAIDSAETDKRKADPSNYGPVYEHPSRRLGYTVNYGLRMARQSDGGMMRAYIPGLLQDNPILMQRDPGYIHRIEAMPEPYRSAYLDGDWEIFLGQVFNFNKSHHVCAVHPLPAYAPVYFTFDWGFGAPFSCGWCYTDADGRIFRFAEWYGWTKTPNQGLRLADSEIAEGIIEHEIKVGVRAPGGRHVDGFDIGVPKVKVNYILSPDCFQKKPDYRGGGQGPSTSEIFSRYGINGTPGDATRDQKIKQFHERLRVPRKENERPMFQVFDSCKQFIRTIPLLQQDEHNPEDVDTTLEDHIYDEQALLFMARPIALKVPPSAMSSHDKRLQELYKSTIADEEERRLALAMEQDPFSRDETWFPADGEYEDGERQYNRDPTNTVN